MGDRDSKSKFSKRGGDGDDKTAAPVKESSGLSGMARRFATVEDTPAPGKKAGEGASAKAKKPK